MQEKDERLLCPKCHRRTPYSRVDGSIRCQLCGYDSIEQDALAVWKVLGEEQKDPEQLSQESGIPLIRMKRAVDWIFDHPFPE